MTTKVQKQMRLRRAIFERLRNGERVPRELWESLADELARESAAQRARQETIGALTILAIIGAALAFSYAQAIVNVFFGY